MIPFPRRYRYTALAAAVVAACALFGVGYLAGGAGGTEPVRTVAMSGASQATAELDLFEKDAAGNWPMELRVSGLPEGRYELWLTRDGKLAEPCGAFAVAAGETTVPLNAPYTLKGDRRLGRRALGKTRPATTASVAAADVERGEAEATPRAPAPPRERH